MEIIHLVVGSASQAQTNGISKLVHELATRQQFAGYNVSVWTIADNSNDLPKHTYPTRIFGKRHIPFALPRGLERAILKENRTSVFHIHGAFQPVIYTAASLMDERDIPYIVTPHGSYSASAMTKNSLARLFYFRWFERPTLHGSSAIHLFNDTEAEGLHEWYHSRKTVRLPFGFDVVENAGKLSSDEAPFIIAYCGRLAMERKGLDLLITGFQRFHKVYPESRLWMIGDGEDRELLYQIVAEQGLEQAVIWHGPQYGEDKLRLLQQCDVFAHISRYAGMPSSLLEAAALGIPLLITEGTNADQCIREYGAGVVLSDACSMQVADGMTHLYKDIVMQRGASRLRGAAIQMIKDVFSWDKLVGKYGQMYKQAIAS